MIKSKEIIRVSGSIDHEVILPIYNIFLNAFKNCEKVSTPYLNLMGFVFHEAMYFTSCYAYDKYWYRKESNLDYPFLGYRSHKFSSINKHPIGKKRKIITALSKYLTKSNPTVSIVNPSGLDLSKLLLLFFKNRIRVSFPENSRITIPNYSQQIEIIEIAFSKIWNEFKLGKKHHRFIDAIKYSYKELNKRTIIKDKYDVLIIGSPVKIPVRAEAAMALSSNIPTICVDHGNESGSGDHPVWGFDEQSYCSHFVGYGSAWIKAVENGKYIKPLFSKPKYIKSNSTYIKANYVSKKIDKLDNDLSNLKFAYIPTKLMGSKRIGPFLSISDEEYIAWQKYLFKVFSNLDYKAHPKQKIDHQIGDVNIIHDNIENCVNKYDGFIVDTVVTTAFANIAATNKPIIYFNIGFGNLSSVALKPINDRVIWVDVDINNPGDIVKRIEKKLSKPLINNFTNQFCIIDDNNSREKTVVDIVKRIVK